MAVLHRTLFTWFIILVFLIFLVLRLDRKVQWNWFLIFIPLWLFDCIVLTYTVFNMILHCKTGYDRNDFTMLRKVWSMVSVLLKMIFQVLLCMKLQYYPDTELHYVMFPFWILIIGVTADISRGLYRIIKSPST